MSNSLKQSLPLPLFYKNILLSASYFIGMYVILMLISKVMGNNNSFSRSNLLNWDAAHYYYIAQKGYTGFRVAFFPLFPFLWKALGGGIYTIVLLNGLIFILSFSALAAIFEFSLKQFLLMLTFPSLVFMFLPFSEALFFMGCTLSIVGMKLKRNDMGFIGMLIASLTRPVIYVFIPALILMALVIKNKDDSKRLILYILAIITGLVVVITLQYSITQDWLAFFHAQKLWGNTLQIPHLHFTSWSGDNMVRFDGTAFLTGMIATVALVYMFIKKKITNTEEPQLFSLLYLAGICWIILVTRGGSMFSLNRFVFATPFFFVALYLLLKRTWQIKEYVFIFFGLNAFWLLFGSYVHILQVLSYLLLTLFLMSFLLISHPKKYIGVTAFSICLLGNMFLQVYYYYGFLGGLWVG